ncbi:hypothetical protein SAMN02910369_02572 [Lachnospiraceae bacterium NE2001]|nr:hypothetical protein SAMN02910369_02572 [Lachnospiraceae bacterium NE2001]
MENTEEMEVNINILSLLYRVLKRWRLLIICMIIGGVTFNTLFYIKSKKRADNVQHTIEEYNEKLESGVYDDNGNTIMSLPDFEKNLTNRQISEVNNLVSTYKMYQGPYSNTVEYINSSILMQIDPKAAPTYIIQYSIDTHYSVEYPEINKRDYTQDILNSISNFLLTSDTFKDISDKLSNEETTVESTYIQELISTGINNDIFIITVHGRTKQECEIITDTIKDQMPDIFKKLKGLYVDFDYTLLSENYYETYDRVIQSAQQSKADELNNIYKTTQGLIQNLTDDQKSYFYALLNNENTISVELPVEADSNEEDIDPSTLEIPSVRRFSLKYTIVGLFLGLFVSFVMIIVITLLNGRIIDPDVMEICFGISQLGVWRVSKQPKGVFAWLDKLLIRLLDSRGEYNNTNDGFNRIITDISLSSSLNEWNTIYVATTSKKSQTIDVMSLLADELQKKNMCVKFGNSLYSASSSLEFLIESDAVVIVEQTDISRLSEVRTEYNLCNRYNLPIIGYVTLK